METVTLTMALILDGVEKCGALNRAQMDLLEVPRPLVSGWKERLIGKEISINTYKKFLELKGVTRKIVNKGGLDRSGPILRPAIGGVLKVDHTMTMDLGL